MLFQVPKFSNQFRIYSFWAAYAEQASFQDHRQNKRITKTTTLYNFWAVAVLAAITGDRKVIEQPGGKGGEMEVK